MSDSFNSYLANLGDVTVEQVPQRDHPATEVLDGQQIEPGSVMDSRQTVSQQEDKIVDAANNEQRKKTSPNRQSDDCIEEMRAEGSADDMELDETIDSRIGMRIESERQQIRAVRSGQEEEEDDDSMDAVNLLDSLPLEGAPIEGEEVTEAFLLGKEDDEDEEEEKSSTRSDEADNLEASKRLGEHDDNLDPAKKKQKKEDGSEVANDAENEKKMDKKTANMRRNIREVMDETQLDEATLAAQRQEMERLRRVQEQQRIIREVQRRQISKGTSLLRSNLGVEDDPEVRLPSSVQLKVNSNLSTGGQVSVSQQSTLAPRRPMAEGCRWQKGGRGGLQGSQTSISRIPSRGNNTQANVQQRVRMMTPSVSISPVVAKKEPVEHLEYYTDSDLSDVDVDYADAEESIMADKEIMQAHKTSSATKPVQKAGKGKDVVTISSSSESSDDDCIVLSDPSEAEETDNDDDPANSGMHTNDRYNVPDDKGRVLVNVGHPEDEPDVFLAPQIARIIKAHQIGGIRFLYDNIVESIERFKTSTGFGCILAHSMGLGKTLQVACFCDIFFRCTDAKTVLCIMPINTLQNWLAEFNMWLPYEDPNKSKIEEKANIKEESNQSDLGYMSRQSSEHDSSSQHPPAPIMTPETSPYPPPHPSYNQTYNPYAPAPSMYDPRYGSAYPGYKPDPYGIPQYGYPPPAVPTYQDPHAPYPTYGVPYPTYGAQPRPEVPPPPPPLPPPPPPPEMKKESPPAVAPPENQVKPELKEEPKKEGQESKKEGEKDGVTVKTPYSVDAPPDLEVRPRHFSLHILNDSHKTMAARARVIREWQKVGGVLLIGYELYRQLSLKKPNKAKKKRGQPFRDLMAEDDDKNKPLLDEMHTALVNPGPDLVICDEGHRIKNSHASISLALKQMRTKRRIVLTGYPLQNNLLEYWCMVDFVRPNYLGTKSEFCNMFERPIQNGQCIDSTPQDIRLMRYRAHVLHSLLEGFVQRRSHSVLQVSLPRKEEYILLVRMTPHQRKLYDTFMNQVVKTRAVPNPLKAFAVCCKIWNHPDVLYHFLKKRQANEEDDLDLEETMADKAAIAAGLKRPPKARALKGEGKKGKKAGLKNKPAASVQPNSSGMSMENGEIGEQQTQGFQNFNAPPPPPAQGSAFPQQPQNNYQQQQGGYQNYQGEEYNNYYGNQNQQSQYSTSNNPTQQSQSSFPASGNKNQQAQPPYPAAGNQNQPSQSPYPPAGNQNQPTQSPYPPAGNQNQPNQQSYPPISNQNQQNQQQPYPPAGNQTQQSYLPAGNQTFPPYAQNSSYPPSNQAQPPSQQYQAQPQQNYGERFPRPSPTGPSPSPSTQNYRPEQNQPAMTAPGSTANYPRPSLPYQSSENTSYQGQTYSQPDYQNQQPNQIETPSYGTYPPNNQGYGSTLSQPLQQNYSAGSQQQQLPQQQSQSSTGYQQSQQQQSQATAGYQQPQQQTSNPPATNYSQNQQPPVPYAQQTPTASTNQQYSSPTAQHQPYVNTANAQSYANPATQQPQNQQYSSTNAQANQPYSSSTSQSHQPYANSTAQGAQPQSSTTPMQNQTHSYVGAPSATTNPIPPPSITYNSNQTQPQQSQQPQGYQVKGLKGGCQDQSLSYQQSQVPAGTAQQSQFGYSNQQQKQQPYQQSNQQQQAQSQQYQQPPVQQSQQQQQQYQQPPAQQSQPQQPQAQQYQQSPVQQSHQQQPQAQQYQQPSGQQTQQQSQSQQYQQPPGQQTQQQPQSQQYQQPSIQQTQQQPQSQPYQQPSVQQPQQQTQQYQQQPLQQPQQYQQQQPTHGYNPQIPAYQPNNQQPQQAATQQGSIGYQQNQAASTNTPAQTQYGYQSQPNQPVQNYQQPAQTIKPESSYGYPPTGNNYSSTPNNSTTMPTANQTPSTPQQPAQGQNQYWQGTSNTGYPNSNDPYYNQNSTQYQTNYQADASGNYQTNQQPQQQIQYQSQSNTATQSMPSNLNNPPYNNPTPSQNITEPPKDEDKGSTDQEKDKDKEDKSDDEALLKDEMEKGKCSPTGMANSMNVFKDQEPGIPYDWATELMKGYVPGLIDASAKMTIFFCILEEAIRLGDRVLAFSQSLFTLNLIEDFLARNDFKYADGKTESWGKNTNYYRLDGSTSALEREKLINEFNANPKIHLFLVSTRAGSLGINLVGANRAIVFDASWNPCHDTQAVCRVYRYGQQKNCYVYRLVTDNCLERKIYDRQISKQGMSDRVVDQCNPDAHLSLKEATTLNWDWEEDSDPQDFSNAKDKYPDEVMHIVLDKYSTLLTKQPFHHESLLVDRKDKKLSQAEKRLARRGYELEKMAATSSRPSYNYVPGNTAARVSVQSGSIQIRQIRDGPTPKPVASVRPMQQRGADGISRSPGASRWIPAEVWQRQGMSAQEMTLPLDVVIPTNSPDKGSIVLKAGQRVMVLKSPKGIYMQLESGKIIAIRTALKVNQGGKKDEEPAKKGIAPMPQRNNVNKAEVSFPLRNNSAISIIPKTSTSSAPIQPSRPMAMRTGVNYRPFGEKEVVNRRKSVATAAAKPYNTHFNSNQMPMSRMNKSRPDEMGDNSNSLDGHKVRPEQRVEEVRIEDVVSEKGSNSEYSPASSRLSSSDTDTNLPRPMMETKRSANFTLDNHSARMHGIHAGPYVTEPKMNVPRKMEMMNRPQERKSDGGDDVIIEDPSKRLHQPYQPYQQQPTRPQPRPAAPRAETSKPTPIPTSVKPTGEMESQPLSGYPYAQYPRYYDYTDPRTRPLADPYASYFPQAPKPAEEKSKTSTEAASFSRPTKETAQPTKTSDATSTASSTAPVREDPHGPTAFSHPSSVRPAYPPGPYPPYDPYAQHYPAPAGTAAYSAGAAAAAAATYPAYGTPGYNADYARMYPGFPPPPPPTAADPYRSYGPPPPSAAGPPSNYYAPFPHPPPPPYPNYSFLPPYPNPGVPAEPQPPAP